MTFRASSDIPWEPALSDPIHPALLLRHSPILAGWALHSMRFCVQELREGQCWLTEKLNVSVQKGNVGGGRVREMTVWGRWRESKRVLTTQTDFGKL